MNVLKKLYQSSGMKLFMGALLVIFCVCPEFLAIEVTAPIEWNDLDIRSDQTMTDTPWISQVVPNVNQCLRLCWLYKACTLVAFNAKLEVCSLYGYHYADVNQDGIYDMPTVRNDDSAVVGLIRASLDKQRVDNIMKNRGCDKRPCSENHLCSPVQNLNEYVCLPLVSVYCAEDPPGVANSVMQPDGVISVLYTCEEYYVRSGTTFVSTCDRITGSWSPVNINCTFVNCGAPPEIEGATLSGASTFYGSEVTYTCLEGASSSSEVMTITCQANGEWTQPPADCIHIDCGSPPPVLNASVTYLERRTSNAFASLSPEQLLNSVGSIVDYSCEAGYDSIAGALYISECQADSAWSPTNSFICTPVDCGNPPFLSNSYRNNDPPDSSVPQSWTTSAPLSTTLGSEIFYLCHSGHTFPVTTQDGIAVVLSELSLICGVNSTWDYGRPTLPVGTNIDLTVGCQRVNCGSPPDKENAIATYNSTFSTAEAIYDCTEPSVSDINGVNNVILCGQDGGWSFSSFTCTRVPCGIPPRVNHSTVSYHINSTTNLFMANYTCDADYILGSDDAKLICKEENLTWEGEVSCVPFNCGEPPDVQHASVFETGRELMDNATYTCDLGYKVSNTTTFTSSVNITCTREGVWSEIDFVCDNITCNHPKMPEKAKIASSAVKEYYDYGFILQFSCIENYIFASSNNTSITCTENGWESAVPEEKIHCVHLPCGDPPVVADASFELNLLHVPMVAKYTCSEGYHLRSPDVDQRTCPGENHADMWSSDDIACDPVDCAEPPLQHGAFVAGGTSTTYGSIMTFGCHEGYVAASGNFTRICQEDADWSGEPLLCEHIDCGIPPNWRNATPEYTTTTYSSIATYSCDEGHYNAIWNSSCLPTGQWDTMNSLTCDVIDCGLPDNLLNATYSLAEGTLYNATVIYGCDTDHFVLGDKDLGATMKFVCGDYGQWVMVGPVRAATASCDIPRCPELPDIENAYVINKSLVTGFVGSNATYNCSFNFQMFGNSQLTCLANMSWSFPLFECSRIDCGVPLPVKNTSMDFTDTAVGSSVNFKCEFGEEATGSSMSRQCLSTGRWSNNFIECVQNGTLCGDPPEVEHASRNFTSIQPGAEAIYTCDEGYSHSWLDVYICLESGFWWSPLVQCEPVDCGPPPHVEFATPHYDRTTFGSLVTYVCDDNKHNIFGVTKSCLASGIWTDSLAECAENHQDSCGQPVIPEHSKIKLFSGSTDGSSILFTCTEGYRGDDFFVQCQFPFWKLPESAPCVPVNCGAPPSVNNAAKVHTSGDIFGSVAKYECSPAHYHTGSSIKSCQADGTWSNNLVECAPIGVVSCGEPPKLDNSILSYESRVESTTATYNCADGFNGTFESICLNSGRWTSDGIFACEPIECGDPTSSTVYQTIFISTRVRRTAAYVCDAGHSPFQPVLSTCLENGNWSSISGICTFVAHDTTDSCSLNPPEVEHATVTLLKTLAFYECDAGYWPLPTNFLTHSCLLGSPGWSDEPVRCEPTVCVTVPTVTNAQFLNHENNLDEMVIAYYQCDIDHTNRSLVCNMRTGWEDSSMLCPSSDCGREHEIDHAFISLYTGDTYGSVIEYECIAPYYQRGSGNSSMCQTSGEWSKPDMECEPCDQKPESPVANSTLAGFTSSVADVLHDEAELRCDDLFYFVGSSDRFKCVSIRGVPQWSGAADAFCAQVHWENPTTNLFEVYPEAIITKFTACTTFIYLGLERVTFTLQKGQGDSLVMSPARVSWYDDFGSFTNALMFLSKTANGEWEERVFKKFDLEVQSRAEFCIEMDITVKELRFLHNGDIRMEMRLWDETPYSEVKYVSMVQNNVEVLSVTLTYD